MRRRWQEGGGGRSDGGEDGVKTELDEMPKMKNAATELERIRPEGGEDAAVLPTSADTYRLPIIPCSCTALHCTALHCTALRRPYSSSLTKLVPVFF